MKPCKQLAWDLKELFPFPSLSFESESPVERRAQRLQQAFDDSQRILEFAKSNLEFIATENQVDVKLLPPFDDTSSNFCNIDAPRSELLLEAKQRNAHYYYRQLVEAYSKANSTTGATLQNKPRISVLAPTCRPAKLPNLLRQFFTQDYPNLELLLLLHHPNSAIASMAHQNAELVT